MTNDKGKLVGALALLAAGLVSTPTQAVAGGVCQYASGGGWCVDWEYSQGGYGCEDDSIVRIVVNHGDPYGHISYSDSECVPA